jgi:hypothetical protein
MLLFSNPQSVAKGRPSLLAIIETIIAIALTATVAIKFNTLMHVIVGSLIAPFLLLRSPESVRLGLKWFQRAIPQKTIDNPARQLFFTLIILFLSIAIRIGATLRHVVKGIPEIPSNWSRVVLCTDALSPVEFVPGSGNIKNTMRRYVDGYSVAFDGSLILVVSLSILSTFLFTLFIAGTVAILMHNIPNCDKYNCFIPCQ